MVEVRVTQTDEYMRLEMDGHAGYNPGSDIVCAGASAIAFTLLGWVENHPECRLEAVYESGRCMVKAARTPEAAAVMEAVVIGLCQLAAAYPDHVSVAG